MSETSLAVWIHEGYLAALRAPAAAAAAAEAGLDLQLLPQQVRSCKGSKEERMVWRTLERRTGWLERQTRRAETQVHVGPLSMDRRAYRQWLAIRANSIYPLPRKPRRRRGTSSARLRGKQ